MVLARRAIRAQGAEGLWTYLELSLALLSLLSWEGAWAPAYSMEIRLLSEPIPLSEVAALAKEQFGEMVKATVDVERGLLALGGELHCDEEALLLEDGSRQESLWGINIYPEKSMEDLVEFDSMINVRPSQNNRSRGVENAEIRARILAVVEKLIHPR